MSLHANADKLPISKKEQKAKHIFMPVYLKEKRFSLTQYR